MKRVLAGLMLACGLTGCVYIHTDGKDMVIGDHSVVESDAAQWRAVDAQNTLMITTQQGPIYVELRPEVAPQAVERIKLLTRRGSYDGLQFWRVVPKFVVQIDVGNVEGGKTELPNLPPEFRFRMKPGAAHTVVSRPQGLEQGFVGATPYVAVEENSTATPKAEDDSRSAWVTYCNGVVGMGRDNGRDTANAEVFFMTGAYPGLDGLFTPVGRVISGQSVLDGLPQGEPPAQPGLIQTVKVLADVPNAPKVEIMDTDSAAFAKIVAAARKTRGADFSVCDVEVPARIVQ